MDLTGYTAGGGGGGLLSLPGFEQITKVATLKEPDLRRVGAGGRRLAPSASSLSLLPFA